MVVIIIPSIVIKIVLRLQQITDIPGYGHTTHKNDRSHWIIIYWNLVYLY